MLRLKELVENISFEPHYNAEALEEYLRTEVSEQYRVPYEPEGSVDPTAEVSRKEAFEELIQHLTDLGYLTEDELFVFNSTGALPENISPKLDAYFSDDAALAAEYTLPPADPTSSVFIEFLPILNERLSLLTSLDGDLKFQTRLRIGDKTIYSRVLHFRLSVLQLYDNDKGDAVSEESVIGAYHAMLLCRKINHDEFGRYARQNIIEAKVFSDLGNMQILLHRFSSEYPEHGLGYYEFMGATPEASFPYLFVHREKLISSTDKDSFFDKLQDAGFLLRPVWSARKPAPIDLHNDQVRFGRKLIQNVLWMTGFYHGRLDGMWGEVTHQALLDFAALDGELRREDMVVYTGNNIWAFSFKAVSEKLLKYLQAAPAPIEEIEEQLSDRAEDEMRIRAMVTDEQALSLKTGPEKENISFVRRFFEGIKRIGRRVYYSARSLIHTALNGLKDIWKFIEDRVVGPAANFFRHLFRQIRQGIRTFFDGVKRFVHFLLRKPVTTINNENTHLISSRYDLDSDCITFISDGSAAALIAEHNGLVMRLTNQLAVFLRVTGKIIGLIISLRPPFGWIRLALKIGAIVMEEVRRKLRRS
jgi:hypothetical protein